MTTACDLFIPTASKVNGAPVLTYPETGKRFFANVKSYGGTESMSNGMLMIEDTVVVTTWYRPDIKAKCRVKLLPAGAVYEVIGDPENWEMRCQYLAFKCRRVKGSG